LRGTGTRRSFFKTLAFERVLANTIMKRAVLRTPTAFYKYRLAVARP
jgi:hypothetical protein